MPGIFDIFSNFQPGEMEFTRAFPARLTANA